MSYKYLDKIGLERVKEKIDAKISFDSDLIHTTTVQEFGEAFGEVFSQALEEKQDTLVSGANIKTINNQSVLGSGNIEIQSSVQSDWNQNDNTADDYVKNRTHYRADDGYVTQYNSSNAFTVDEYGYSIGTELPSSLFYNLSDGQETKITVNDIVVGENASIIFYGDYVYLSGNTSYGLGYENSEDNFYLRESQNGGYLYINRDVLDLPEGETEYNYTVKIETTNPTYKKIDQKYLPEAPDTSDIIIDFLLFDCDETTLSEDIEAYLGGDRMKDIIESESFNRKVIVQSYSDYVVRTYNVTIRGDRYYYGDNTIGITVGPVGWDNLNIYKYCCIIRTEDDSEKGYSYSIVEHGDVPISSSNSVYNVTSLEELNQLTGMVDGSLAVLNTIDYVPVTGVQYENIKKLKINHNSIQGQSGEFDYVQVECTWKKSSYYQIIYRSNVFGDNGDKAYIKIIAKNEDLGSSNYLYALYIADVDTLQFEYISDITPYVSTLVLEDTTYYGETNVDLDDYVCFSTKRILSGVLEKGIEKSELYKYDGTNWVDKNTNLVNVQEKLAISNLYNEATSKIASMNDVKGYSDYSSVNKLLDEYNTYTTYNQGDFVYYTPDGIRYAIFKCIETTSGEFDDTKWEQTIYHDATKQDKFIELPYDVCMLTEDSSSADIIDAFGGIDNLNDILDKCSRKIPMVTTFALEHQYEMPTTEVAVVNVSYNYQLIDNTWDLLDLSFNEAYTMTNMKISCRYRGEDTPYFAVNSAETISIPTKTSDLTNDSGFLTSHQDISGKEDKSNKTNSYTISSTTTYPNTKALVDGLATKQETLVSGTNIKTINNESILGSGNITTSSATYFNVLIESIDDVNKLIIVDWEAGTLLDNYNTIKSLFETKQQVYLRVKDDTGDLGGLNIDLPVAFRVEDEDNTGEYLFFFSALVKQLSATINILVSKTNFVGLYSDLPDNILSPDNFIGADIPDESNKVLEINQYGEISTDDKYNFSKKYYHEETDTYYDFYGVSTVDGCNVDMGFAVKDVIFASKFLIDLSIDDWAQQAIGVIPAIQYMTIPSEVRLKDYMMLFFPNLGTMKLNFADPQTGMTVSTAEFTNFAQGYSIIVGDPDNPIQIIYAAMNKDNYLAKDNTQQYVPTSDYHPATKKYVDDHSGGIQSETDPVFTASAAYGISSTDISNWNGKQDAISDLSTIRTNASNAIQQGGTLSAPLKVTGGDSNTAGKIILDEVNSGQITNSNESTLFGFLSDGTSDLAIGSSSYNMKLRGRETRPKYNNKDVALKSDVDSKTSNTGTVTEVRMNGTSKGTGGVVDLGDVLTEHQQLKTINGQTISGSGDIEVSVTGSGMLYRSGAYNVNTCYDAGIYVIKNGTNCPGSDKAYGMLLVAPYNKESGNTSQQWGSQLFFPCGSDSKRNSIFYRSSAANSWYEWQEISSGSIANPQILYYGNKSLAPDIENINGVNYFNDGNRQNQYGVITSGSGYQYSDLIPIFKGDIINYKLSGSTGDGLVCIFNSSKNFVECVSEGNGWGNYKEGEYTFTLEDTGYVRICCPQKSNTQYWNNYYFKINRASSITKVNAMLFNNTNEILKLYDNSETIQKLKNLTWQSRLHGWDNQEPKPFMFLHFTDIHVPTNASTNNLDSTPLARMMEFYKKYQSYFIDIVHSGDTAYDAWGDGIDYWNNVNGTENILNCLGNHDINNLPSGTTKTNVYNRYFGDIANWNVTQPANAQANGKMYYYKDYTTTSSSNITSKMRLIVLDSATVVNGDTSYASEQATWLRDVLESARQEGRAVMTMYHHIPKYDHFDRCAFDSVINNESLTSNFDQIYREIDTFIENGGEFIMHIVGHTHYDCCGTVANTNTLTLRHKQIIYAGTLSSWSHTDWGIQHRNDNDESIDNFTAIAINTIDKKITFARFGAKYDMFMQRKDRMCLDYNDAKVVYSS